MINIPNALTLLRILLVPLFLSLVADGSMKLALIVFVAAGITDGIDGLIARLTDSRTELGAHLDPLADKLLLVSAFIAMGLIGYVPLQLMILVIMRDVVILGGYITSAILVGKAMEMNPSVWGKATTFFQITTVSLVMVSESGWLVIPADALTLVFVVTGTLTIVSGIGYVFDGIRWYQTVEP